MHVILTAIKQSRNNTEAIKNKFYQMVGKQMHVISTVKQKLEIIQALEQNSTKRVAVACDIGEGLATFYGKGVLLLLLLLLQLLSSWSLAKFLEHHIMYSIFYPVNVRFLTNLIWLIMCVPVIYLIYTS
jgi:hypothetical protein